MGKNKYQIIRKSVELASESYINTRVVATSGDISFDLKDILILGAITGTDCLITGKTGSGKTKIANLVMKGLFGDKNYTNKTVTPAMQPEDFLDIDFNIMKDGGNLQDAIKPLSILKKPGIILNETNRAPGIIQNYLIPFLDKEMDIMGKEFSVGVKIDGCNENYQFRVITINEGEDYAVEGIDKALRDRTVIEIPVDIFYQTCKDCFHMLTIQGAKIPSNPIMEEAFEDVSAAYKEIQGITIQPNVLVFIVYLSGMSYCCKIKSNPKIKESINFSPRICTGCHYCAQSPFNMNNLCGNVFAPSQRALINLIKVGKGIAYMRGMKSGKGEDLMVTIDDILAVAPFILYKKIGMQDLWLDKYYQGNRFEAIKEVMRQVYGRYQILLNKFKLDQGDMMSSFEIENIEKFSEENNDMWVYRLLELSKGA